MKNYNDTIGNRTLDLPTCSTVPQPTAPPRTPLYMYIYKIYKSIFTKPQVGSKIRYENRWSYFLEVRKSIKRCEMFPTILVALTFIVFFKVSGKHQTGAKFFLLSFLLTNVYVLRKPFIDS